MRALHLFLALLSVAAAAASESPIASATRADTDWLANVETRVVGTAEHDRIQRQFIEQVMAVPNVRVWTQRFPVVVPKIEQAELSFAAGKLAGTHRVYPFWPALARLNTTPADGIDGQLIYVGMAGADELPAKSLRGNIAVMEIGARDRWQDAYNAGARAVIVLGSENETNVDSENHLSNLPINVPRFYVPPGSLAEALRHLPPTAARLYCKASWETATATNVYALVQPATKSAEPALTLSVPFDSMSVVPELAPGADAAIDSAFLLNVLRHFAAHPPGRPVLFTFLDGYSIAHLGTRQMLYTLATPAGDKQMADYRERDQEKLDKYLEQQRLAEELGDGPEAIRKLRQDDYRPLHRVIKDEIAREVIGLDAQLNPKRIERFKASPERKQALNAEIRDLALRKQVFLGTQTEILSKPKPEPTQLARTIWSRARLHVEAQLRETQALLDEQAARDRLRDELNDALGLDKSTDIPLQYMLGIDLTDAGVSVGPQAMCGLTTEGVTNLGNFNVWILDVEKNERVWSAEEKSVLNLRQLKGEEFPTSYRADTATSVTSPADCFGLPSMNWTSIDCKRLRVDTPRDRADLLDWKRIAPQLDATFSLIKRLAATNDFAPRRGRQTWARVDGLVVDESPGEPVPRLPMQGYLTTLISGSGSNGGGPVALPKPLAMRREEFVFSGSDGGFRFDALLQGSWFNVAEFVQSYSIASDGVIRRAIDQAQSGSGALPNSANLNGNRYTDNIRVKVFTCKEVTATRLFDPRYMMPLGGSLLDTARKGDPKRFNYLMSNGVMSAFLEENTPWGLVLRAGVTRNALVQLNIDAAASAEAKKEVPLGFDPGAPFPSNPTYQAARDFHAIDQVRIDKYKAAGIRSQAIEDLHAAAGKLLDDSEKALAEDDGKSLTLHASAALSTEIRAYQSLRDTANDVIRAAVFLLLGLVPFAFVFERLVFASAHIYRQLALTALVFATMTAILWSFHPAFKISDQPLMVIMAFAILCMSLLVISMIYAKFSAGIEQWRSGRAESSGARTSRWGVISTAIRLGIANMRKRKVRTTLTGITVVLITFALLCFSSTSSYTGQRDYALKSESPYTGVFIREASLRPLEAHALNYANAVLDKDAVRAAQYWCVMPWQGGWRMHVRNPANGKQASMRAALGLDGAESQFSGIDRLCVNWPRFAAGKGCYLAQSVAEELGAKIGDRVVIAGRDLELLGAFNAQEMDKSIRTLDGQPLMPTDFSVLGIEMKNRVSYTSLTELAGESEKGSAMASPPSLTRLPSDAVVILPNSVLQGLPDVALRNISVKTADLAAAKVLAQDLAGRIAYPIYYSAAGGTHVLASTPLLPTAPKSLLIPLLIGGMIIFNTMLSSISERKREIHVYTSLGLAPLHIAVLFLAEAATYGLMGAIFGYIVGQGVATGFNALGWMGNITLNYSGSQTIMVMAAVMAVVMISSLIPAYMAGKLAAPSNDMTWEVPAPVNDVIHASLPFTVTGATANGMTKYLLDYFDAHKEGSIGHFSTDELRVRTVTLGGKPFLSLAGVTWLAPYDLSVNQEFRISYNFTEDDDVYTIEIELRRTSGQPDNWYGLNKVFLGDLRKQLLGWRNLTPAQIRQYIVEGRALVDLTEHETATIHGSKGKAAHA